MNTRIIIQVNSNHSRPYVYSYIDKAFEQFEYVVKHFSRFDSKSDLSVMNSNTDKWQKVSQELFFLIKFALDIAKKTDGIFDPTVIDILEKYGYDKNYNFSKLEDKELQTKITDLLSQRANYSKVQLKDKSQKIKLAPNQGIDLGAIGKGYAIDLAYQVLEEKFKNFFINAGGDIRVKGVNGLDKPWKVKLEYIDENNCPQILGFIELNEGSICSSGAYARKVKDFHHLIDTKTGEPQNKTVGTFVLAPTALLADTYSTVVFLMGESSLRLLEKEEDVEGIVILNGKRITPTSFFPLKN